MFMKKLFYLIALVAFTLTSCEKNELVKQEISHVTEQKIDNILSIIDKNPNFANSIQSSFASNIQRVSSNGEMPEIDLETQKAMEEFAANPRLALEEIAVEEMGAEKIDLLESVYLQEESSVIIEKLKSIVPTDSLEALNTQLNDLNVLNNPMMGLSNFQKSNIGYNYYGINLGVNGDKLDLSEYDKQLHFMAGAASAIVIASAAYFVFKWAVFTPWLKAGALLAVGIGAAAFFGAAKEIFDDYMNKKSGENLHSVSWNDFWATVLGGVTGSAFTAVTLITIKNPVIAGICVGVGAIIVGYCPAATFILKRNVCQ
jgi:hypothetical protein